MNISSDIKYIIFDLLIKILKRDSTILNEKYTLFFLNNLEKLYVKIKKIEILGFMTNEYNFHKILDELNYYLR